MMILPFLFILLQCSVDIEGVEKNKDEKSLSDKCLSTQIKTIIVYLDIENDLYYPDKVDFVTNTLQYLVEMLLKRSTCFKLSVFSPRRGAIVELTEDVVIENFLDNEFPWSFYTDEFSILLDQLQTTNDNQKHVLFFVSSLNTGYRDHSLISTQLRQIHELKGYEVIFLCMLQGYLCSLIEQWISPNRLIMNNAPTFRQNYFDNMNKELLDVLKNPDFNHLQMYENLNLQNSSFGECKTQMHFRTDFWLYSTDLNGCSSEKYSLRERLMFFVYQIFSSPITIFHVRYEMGEFAEIFHTARLNSQNEYSFGRNYFEYSIHDVLDKFNIQPFCNIHIDIDRIGGSKTCIHNGQPNARYFKGADSRIKVLIDEDENDRPFVKKEDGTIVIWERDLDSVEFKTMIIEEIRQTKCANGCRFV